MFLFDHSLWEVHTGLVHVVDVTHYASGIRCFLFLLLVSECVETSPVWTRSCSHCTAHVWYSGYTSFHSLSLARSLLFLFSPVLRVVPEAPDLQPAIADELSVGADIALLQSCFQAVFEEEFESEANKASSVVSVRM